MARIRSIKPELRTSLRLADTSREVRYLFVLLWGYLDDHGRGVDDTRLIKADCLPLDDDVTPAVVDGWLDQLRGPVCRYKVAGRRYLHCPNWSEHQRPSHPNDSRVPECPVHDLGQSPEGEPEDVPEVLANLPETLANVPEVFVPEQGAGSREQGAGSRRALVLRDEPTEARRSRKITDDYSQRLNGMCKWPAVYAIVLKAIRSARYTDADIVAALSRLADEGRSVTVDVLRTELDGLPARASPTMNRAEQRTAGHLALIARLEAQEAQT